MGGALGEALGGVASAATKGVTCAAKGVTSAAKGVASAAGSATEGLATTVKTLVKEVEAPVGVGKSVGGKCGGCEKCVDSRAARLRASPRR